MGSKPRCLATQAILMVMALSLVGCDKAKGIAAVEELCAQDGGERIFDTAYVAGYVTGNGGGNYFCNSCIELLGDRKFEYLDAEVDIGTGAKRLFRYSLGHADDPRCETWRQKSDAPRLLRQLDIREDECVIVTELAGPPNGYVYARRGSTVDVGNRLQVAVDHWEIWHAKSGTVLARVRDYQFTSKLTSLLDMSGHGGNPDATCFKPGAKARLTVTLPERVLRDSRKQTDATDGEIR